MVTLVILGAIKYCSRGKWKGKMIFPETNDILQTDLQLNEMQNEDHYIGPSPFRALPLGMVIQFPIDSMHLIFLGSFFSFG